MMMMLKLKDDLKLKYYLNMHLSCDLDENTVLFEIINYIIFNNIDGKNKDISYNNLKFSTKTLKYIFSDNFNDESFKNNIISNIKSLITNEYINVKSKYFHITRKGMEKFYTLNNTY